MLVVIPITLSPRPRRSGATCLRFPAKPRDDAVVTVAVRFPADGLAGKSWKFRTAAHAEQRPSSPHWPSLDSRGCAASGICSIKPVLNSGVGMRKMTLWLAELGREVRLPQNCHPTTSGRPLIVNKA